MHMKKILLLGTGGTIASKPESTGLEPELPVEELMRFVPKAADFCEVTGRQIMNVDSTNLGPDGWLTIAEAIRGSYDDYDGFVVAHGTDTLAYTAAALSYLIQRSPKPIVLTGAQKPIDDSSTDARDNLYNSLFYASCAGASDVSVVFNDKVIAGTRAKKTRSKSYDAFSSINFPALEAIRDGRIIKFIGRDSENYCADRTAGHVFYDRLDTSVSMLKLIPSMNGNALRAVADLSDAVIIESFGVGGIPEDVERGFGEAISDCIAAGKTIVVATQVTEEGSNMQAYRVGNMIKNEFDLIETYDMTLEAAAAKLMWILGQTKDPAKIREMFYRTVNFDILYR